jgi:hypothetical protein
MKDQAICTPYIDPDDPKREAVLWEWNYCPDCGRKHAHHHDENGRRGIRCG